MIEFSRKRACNHHMTQTMYHKELYYVNVTNYTYSDKKYIIVLYLLSSYISLKENHQNEILKKWSNSATEENLRDREKEKG